MWCLEQLSLTIHSAKDKHNTLLILKLAPRSIIKRQQECKLGACAPSILLFRGHPQQLCWSALYKHTCLLQCFCVGSQHPLQRHLWISCACTCCYLIFMTLKASSHAISSTIINLSYAFMLQILGIASLFPF